MPTARFLTSEVRPRESSKDNVTHHVQRATAGNGHKGRESSRIHRRKPLQQVCPHHLLSTRKPSRILHKALFRNSRFRHCIPSRFGHRQLALQLQLEIWNMEHRPSSLCVLPQRGGLPNQFRDCSMRFTSFIRSSISGWRSHSSHKTSHCDDGR